jgi:hypothetical protein
MNIYDRAAKSKKKMEAFSSRVIGWFRYSLAEPAEVAAIRVGPGKRDQSYCRKKHKKAQKVIAGPAGDLKIRLFVHFGAKQKRGRLCLR